MESQAVAPKAKVEAIFVYPIKSCRGISVSEAPLVATGLRWDRLWLVVNSKGRGYTQRVEPKLALVEVELPGEAFSDGWKPNKSSFLVIKAPGMEVLKIPLTEPSAIADGVSVWEWHGSTYDEGDEAAEWFSNFLGKPSRLMRFNEASESRPINSDSHMYNIKFNDLYPFLLISQGSLDALNGQLQDPVQINRFRPNILVDGCAPFSEDFWKEININNLTFYSVELCYRCKIPTINQETAIGGSEPNATLKEFRLDKVLFPNNKPRGRIYFGHALACKDTLGECKEKTIKVGDLIYVLKMVSSYEDVMANSPSSV